MVTARSLSDHRPGPGPLRPRPLAAALLLFAGAAVLAVAVIGRPYLGPDLAIERWVQSVGWGPLTAVFEAVDWLEGVRQFVVAVLGVAAMWIWWRPAAPLMTWSACSGLLYEALELLERRPRPPAGLVHVIRHTAGYSFPSGHLIFFTWFLGVIVLAFAYRRRPAVRALSVALAFLVLLTVAAGRIQSAEHWPSDVLAGFLIGLGWLSLGIAIRPLSRRLLDE